MQFYCSKENLNYALNSVYKAVAVQHTLPILEGIYIRAYDNILTICATNLEIGIETRIPAVIEEEGDFVVMAKLFTDVVKKFPNENIYFSGDDNNMIHLNCGGSKFSLLYIDSHEYPTLPDVSKDIYFSVDNELFRSMIRQTIFSRAIHNNLPMLTGEKLEIKDGIARLIALDGYRFAMVEENLVDSPEGEIDEIIPGVAMQEAYRLLSMNEEEELKISIANKQIMFEIGSTRLTSRLLEGQYIDYQQLMPGDFETRVKINRRELMQSCERASLLAKERNNNLMKMEFGLDKLLITSHSDMGNVIEEIDIETEGELLTIAFNSKYFIDVLKVLTDEEIILDFTTKVSPCVIRSVEEDSPYIYFILPIRFNDL
jgi:DNA polymerase-3 subunit beta